MSPVTFKTGGALTSDHASVYIEREADRRAQQVHLRSMDYVSVIEPRQQGKTSLVNHLMHHFELDDVNFSYIDVTTLDGTSEATWYQTLCPRILMQLRNLIPAHQSIPIPQNPAGWRTFLSSVAQIAANSGQRVVIVLDEIGAVSFPGVTTFFSVLRDVYNSRQAEKELKELTFWLIGAFRPRDLIKDDKISPFNIAQRLRLPDFTVEQVEILVSRGNWAEEEASNIAERIHYWTDGQPYLTQLLCSYLRPGDASSIDVDISVEKLRREDENHLPALLERLNTNGKLSQYVKSIAAGERIRFYPSINRRHAQLELLGLVKADDNGFCIFRNRIYEWLFQENYTSSSDQAQLFDRDLLIEEEASLLRQLQQYHRTLMRLEEQRAKYSLNVPIDILNGIDDAEQNIKRVETRLQQIVAMLDAS